MKQMKATKSETKDSSGEDNINAFFIVLGLIIKIFIFFIAFFVALIGLLTN